MILIINVLVLLLLFVSQELNEIRLLLAVEDKSLEMTQSLLDGYHGNLNAPVMKVGNMSCTIPRPADMNC